MLVTCKFLFCWKLLRASRFALLRASRRSRSFASGSLAAPGAWAVGTFCQPRQESEAELLSPWRAQADFQPAGSPPDLFFRESHEF